MSINVLETHPDLLPDVVKILSTALTTAQDKTKALELQLQEKHYALLEAEANFETLTEKYERERGSGDELRTALEARFIELRTRETEVEETRRRLEGSMGASTVGSETSAALEARICDECETLRKTLDSNTRTLRAKDERLSALARTHRDLETALRQAQQLDHTRSAEVERLKKALENGETQIRHLTEQIEAKDAAAASLREALETSKLDVSDKDSSLSVLAFAKQELDESLKATEIQIIDLTDRVEEKDSTIRDLSMKLDDAEKQRAAWHTNEQRLKSAAKSLADANEDVQSKLRKKAAELEQSDSQLLARQSELKLVRDGNMHLRSENARLIEEKNNAAETVRLLRERNEALEAERGEIVSANFSTAAADAQLQRLRQQNQKLIKGLEEASGINEASVKENVGLRDTLRMQQNRIDELLKAVAELEEHAAALQAETEKQKEEAGFKNSALLQLGNMYNARETECAELKEALSLQRQERPKPVATQQTPPPTPPPNPTAFAARSPERPPATATTSLTTWATLAARPKKAERSQYLAYMGALPQPVNFGRPMFTDQNSMLQPVAKLDGYDVFSANLGPRWEMLHCPKRTLWCNQIRIHAIVFAPTHVISRQEKRCVENEAMTRYCGQRVEFFANKGEDVYYVGTYVVHSLRGVHPPGGDIPSDVSNHAIYTQMGLTEAEVKTAPPGRVGTECFGMQCVGFDKELYRMLRHRYNSARVSAVIALKNTHLRKRKAEEELGDENEVKTRRMT